MKISIIGTGYVGLVTGVGLAAYGHNVVCVDVDKNKVEKINQGQSPIYEKGLNKLLKDVLDKKLFSATTDLKSAVLNTEVTFIAVGTPSTKNNKTDLSYLKKAAKQIGLSLALKNSYHTVVVKSTVVPETCLKVVLPLIEKNSAKKPGLEFGLCMNPEFLSEGSAVNDFMKPDRIVIGELNKKSGDSLAKLYKSFNSDVIRTSLSNAEMIKYTSNALLGTLISFSNEISNICERIPGIDTADVFKGVYLDKRLNPIINNKRVNPEILKFIWPGCGFGGSCLPKDINALISFSDKKGYRAKLLSAVLNINKKRAQCLVDLTEKKLGSLALKKIGVLGLAFKPDTDDIRESPAIPIIKELINRQAIVSVYDPVVNSVNIKNVNFCKSLNEVIKDKDACLLITKWQEFKKITPEMLKKEMVNPLLIDGRGFLNPKEFKGKINYIKIGLG